MTLVQIEICLKHIEMYIKKKKHNTDPGTGREEFTFTLELLIPSWLAYILHDSCHHGEGSGVFLASTALLYRSPRRKEVILRTVWKTIQAL